MKYFGTILSLCAFVVFSIHSYAYTNQQRLAADFLSYKDIIVAQEKPEAYELDKQITRREMAKVTLKLSNAAVSSACSGVFSDLKEGDWGCKYAEAGVKNGFFAANPSFNADNNISKIEALKMVMKGTKVEKYETEDWRLGYVQAAVKAGLLEVQFSDYDTPATRGWIFLMAQHAIEYGDDEDIQLIEDLLNF